MRPGARACEGKYPCQKRLVHITQPTVCLFTLESLRFHLSAQDLANNLVELVYIESKREYSVVVLELW